LLIIRSLLWWRRLWNCCNTGSTAQLLNWLWTEDPWNYGNWQKKKSDKIL